MRFQFGALVALACVFQTDAWAQVDDSLSATREATPAVVNPVILSPHRQTLGLDGTWDFAADPFAIGVDQGWYRPDVALPNSVSLQVPGCWEAQGIGDPGSNVSILPNYSVGRMRHVYMGVAWYRKNVVVPADWAGNQVWLKIGGVQAQGWFWVNGSLVAHASDKHYCGIYKYNITDLVQPGRPATITAMVRNDVDGVRGNSFMWYHRYGGLIRSVELDATPDDSIDYAWVDSLFDAKSARVTVRMRSMATAEREPAHYQLAVRVSTLDGAHAGAAERTIALSGNSTTIDVFEIPLEPFQAWSPAQPHLYKAEIVLMDDGKAIDGWIERFGVKKYEVRGGNFYLNNQPYFVRGFGDDLVYPLTIVQPASREHHIQNFRMAKKFGFEYVRIHTSVPLPEYFEAADEVGLMLQPELPYNGLSVFTAYGRVTISPKEDLRELVEHYRRYVSLGTYSGGNEGHMGSPMDVELYQLAKELDPSRLFLHEDGGVNTPENSDYSTVWGPAVVEPFTLLTDYYGMQSDDFDGARPTVCHEYLNLAIPDDPRLEPRYTGATLPPRPAALVLDELDRAGLSWEWGMAVQDAAHEMQRLFQKRGLEAARLEPKNDGYIYWTISDVGLPGTAQGLLNHFWDPKASTPEFFRQFNGPVAVLARLTPDHPILSEGETLSVEWWVSPFGTRPITNGTLHWRLASDDTVLQTGEVTGIAAQAGEVKVMGTAQVTIPSLERAIHAQIVAELSEPEFPSDTVTNSYDVWLFPKLCVAPGIGETICASEAVYATVASCYPGLSRLGTPEAAHAKLVLADTLNADTIDALAQGKSVILLELDGPIQGPKLGWWWKNPQMGTAVADHRAFGTFPHQGYLNELFFRLVDRTASMSNGGFRPVEPLMVGYGSKGYLMHVFQARVGGGKILGSGLDLMSEHPESTYLLNEFIDYALSERFQPIAELTLPPSGALAMD